MFNLFNLKPDFFGLDISDFSIRFTQLKKRRNFLFLASWGEKELKEKIVEGGEIKDKKALVEAIKETLLKAKGGKMKTKEVVVSLPEKKCFLQVIQVPKMDEKELETAIPFEAENYIPLPVETVYLDFQIIPPVQNGLDHFDVLIVAVSKNVVDSYLACLKEAGLVPIAMEAESQAITRALVKNGFSGFPVFIIDFGRSSSNFIIFSGYSIRFTTSISISSHTLTETISKFLRVSLDEAEKMKLEYGLSEAVNEKGKKVNEVITPILTDFTKEIARHIDYYQSHRVHEHFPSNGKEIDKIILCGQGANLKGLSGFLSSQLGISVEIANPWVNILKEPLKEVPGLSYKESLGYTTALGLALREKF